jgi:hypothetical protein
MFVSQPTSPISRLPKALAVRLFGRGAPFRMMVPSGIRHQPTDPAAQEFEAVGSISPLP